MQKKSHASGTSLASDVTSGSASHSASTKENAVATSKRKRGDGPSTTPAQATTRTRLDERGYRRNEAEKVKACSLTKAALICCTC